MRFKKPLIIGASILAVLLLAAWVALSTLDLNRFKPRIIQTVKEATGLELAIHGNIELGLGLNLRLLIHDIEIRNASWGSRPEMVTMKRCELKLVLLRLVRGVLEIDHLVFIEPHLLLETDASGMFNFVSVTKDRRKPVLQSTAVPDEAWGLPVRVVKLEKGRITYRSGRTGATYVQRVDRLTLKASTMESPVQVDMAGFLNDRPFVLDGHLGAPADLMLTRQPWPVNLTARIDGAVANIQGVIRNTTRLKDISLQLHAEGTSVSKVLAPAGIPLRADPGPFVFTAVLTNPESVPALEDVDLRIGSPDAVDIRIRGSIGNLPSMQKIQLHVMASCKDLSRFSKNPAKPPPVTGPIAVTGTVHDSGPETLSVHDLRISSGTDSLTGTLDMDFSGNKARAKLTLSSPGLGLEKVTLSFAGGTSLTRLLREIGPADLTLAMVDPFGRAEVEEVDLHLGEPQESEIRVAGRIESLRFMKGTELNFNARGKEAAGLERIFKKPIPVRGPYVISGLVTDLPDKGFVCHDVAVTLGENKGEGLLELHLAGDKPRLNAVLFSRDPDLESIVRPPAINPGMLKALDSLGPFRLAISVVDPAGKPALPSIHARMGKHELVEMSIKGAVGDVRSRRGLDLEVAIQGEEFSRLDRLFRRSLPLKGPFSLKGRILDSEPGVYRLEAVEAMLGKNDIRGWVEAKVEDPVRIDAGLLSQDIDLDVLSPVPRTGVKMLRHIGAWSLKTRMAPSPGRLLVERFDISLAAPDLARARLTGSIQDLPTWQGVDMNISLQGDDLGNFQKDRKKAFPYSGPFALSGRLADPNARMVQVREFNAVFGNNRLEGAFEVSLSPPRPRLAGNISSGTLDLRPLFSKPERHGDTETEPLKAKNPGGKVFPAGQLRLDPLRRMDADMKVHAEQILLPRLAVDKATVHVKIDNGRLEMFPLQGEIGGGSADGRFTLRSKGTTAEAALEFKASQVDLGAMLDELGAAKSVEGILRTEIKAQAQGGSIGALLAGLNGRAVFVLADGRIYNKYIDLLGGGLLPEIYHLINPFSRKEAFSELTCHANHFDIQDGLAVSKIWITDTKYTTVRGAGEIDLGEEQVDMAFRMSPKKSIGIPGLAEIDLNLGDFARSFKVEGTFAQPSVALDPAGAAATLGKMLGGLALFGPIGLAAGLLDLKLGKDHPCLKAVETLENGPGEAEGENAAVERSPESPAQASGQQQGP